MLSGYLIYKNLVNTLGVWNRANKMTVYLNVDASDEDKAQLLQKINALPNVSSVVETDRQKAGLEFQKSLKEYSSGLVTTDELVDLIPETLEVEVDKSLDSDKRNESFANIDSALREHPAVEEVSYSSTWLKKFERLHKFVRSSGLFVFLLILLLLSYLVALMIRAYIDESRQEIEIYNMLGATRWTLYKLFLGSIVYFLAFSLLISFVSLFGLFSYFKGHLGQAGLSQLLVDNLIFLSPVEIVAMAVSIFGLVYLNSFFTVTASINRLNQISND